VVDDGSTDDSRQVIAQHDDVVAIFKRNGGQPSAVNAAFEACHGDWVCILDADDLLQPNAIERAMERAAPGVSKVHWPVRNVDPLGVPTRGLSPALPLDEGDLSDAVVRDGPEAYTWSPMSGNLFSRSFLERVLPLAETIGHVGRGVAFTDATLACLVPLFGRIEAIQTPLTDRRLHGANLSKQLAFEAKLETDTRDYDFRCEVLARWCRELSLEADPDGWRARSWLHRFPRARARIEELVPPGERLVLVDDAQVGPEVAPGRLVVPFTERDGAYWGPPADDAEAMREIDRLVGDEGGWVVVAWPAFWWLEHYDGLERYLRSIASAVVEDDTLIAFHTEPQRVEVPA
jgi:glycosyltransferase involved in cell wall biosynthesis